MNPNHVREEELFDAARELPSAEAQAAYLEKACGADAALRSRIEALLRDDRAAEEFFDTKRARTEPASAPGAAGRATPAAEGPGVVIDRYKLREKLGEGGCGVVYVAEQEQPIRRRVALKILKLGMDTRAVVARFEAERQALAMMDHPNIAKVIDAGTTETGRPYFVMELVRGMKLTDYCRKHALPVGARLELFVKVCRAVQHAHQKGIIHRDLKPSNILVTLHDGVPVPKVIDFGIAKAIEGRLTDHTVYTQLHQFIGTPAYMSPEQAEISGLDIDTRSDIYSLGVLLYELLTSRTPFDPEELLQAGLDEIRRRIREDDPPRPSTRLSTMLEADLTTVARHYAAEPPKLISLLRGDLDWIVMKALEKDRTRRYETANGLAMDVERFLHNEPVLATPPSRRYRLGKFARRNRTAFAAGAAVAVILVAGLLATAWQAVRATRAQERAAIARRAAEEARGRASAERQRAEDSARQARDSERITQRLLYAADMRLAQSAWDEGNLARMTSLLEAHAPQPGADDGRGFDYRYLQALARGDHEAAVAGHTSLVVCLAVAPDGKWLATRAQTETRLWDLAARSPAGSWPSAPVRLGHVARGDYGLSFSHDSRFLAFPSPAGLQFVDLLTSESRLMRTGAVEKPLFSPVGPSIAFSEGPTGRGTLVWDYAANQELGVVGPDRLGWGWSADGTRLLASPNGGMTGSLEWWDASQFKPLATHAVGQYVLGAVISPDARYLAAADWQGRLSLLETAGGRSAGELDVGDVRSSALCFSPDGAFLATASRDQAIVLWNLESRQRVRQLRGHRAKVTCLAYTPDGRRLVSGDLEGRVLVWDLERRSRGEEIPNRLRGYGWGSPQFSADGRFLAIGTAPGETAILDTTTLGAQATLRGHCATFSPDGRQLAFAALRAGQTVLQIAHSDTGLARASIPLGTGNSRGLVFELSPQGDYLALHETVMTPEGSPAIESTLLDTATREPLLPALRTDIATRPSRFLPDGRTWVCAAGSTLTFWDLGTRAQTRTLDSQSSVACVAVSPDGRFLAAGRADFKIALWDLAGSTQPTVLAGHQAAVWAVDFSADGRTLASGSEDRTVKFWDVAARRETASFAEDRPIYFLSFSPDNRTLVVGGIGAYRIWRAPQEGTRLAAERPGTKLMDLPAGSVWRVSDGDAPPPGRALEEKTQCATNLAKIHTAIQAYQRERARMPDWLSDLVPAHLDDTNVLRCPVHARTRPRLGALATEDPVLVTSYAYEFSARPGGQTDAFGLSAPGDTMKAWKMKQLAWFGPLTPVVRCEAHGAVLNLGHSGEVWESGLAWESTAALRLRSQHAAGPEAWDRKTEAEFTAAALNQLAWDWATSPDPRAREGRAAIRLAERAVALTRRQDPAVLDTLAAGYAEAGRFDEAIQVMHEAISRMKGPPPGPDAEATIREFQGRLELYGRRRPYREER